MYLADNQSWLIMCPNISLWTEFNLTETTTLFTGIKLWNIWPSTGHQIIIASCIRLTQLPFLFLKWWGNFFDEIFFFEEFFDKIIDPRTMRRYSCNLNTKIYLLTLKSASSKFTGQMRDCWSTKTWILDLTLRTKDQGNALKSSKDITFKKKNLCTRELQKMI